jgi:hypothetical protein
MTQSSDDITSHHCRSCQASLVRQRSLALLSRCQYSQAFCRSRPQLPQSVNEKHPLRESPPPEECDRHQWQANCCQYPPVVHNLDHVAPANGLLSHGLDGEEICDHDQWRVDHCGNCNDLDGRRLVSPSPSACASFCPLSAPLRQGRAIDGRSPGPALMRKAARLLSLFYAGIQALRV